jgi:hypothetical protein
MGKKGLLLLCCFIYVFGFSFCVRAQTITTIAGTGISGYSGDGGAATSAKINFPSGVAADSAHNIYIADFNNSVVRKVSAAGVITTFAGQSVSGYTGDGGAADSATLNTPQDVAVAPDGSVYIADAGNNVIRKVSTSGIITTVAGNGTGGFYGDGGLADTAELDQPTGITVDRAGNLYIADYNNYRIRKVDTSGIITTVAGNGYGSGVGTGGYSGDGGMATSAELFYPVSVAVDNTGNLYIADFQNNVIRKVNTSGIITTVAGTGVAGFSGEGGAATAAKLSTPSHVAVDTIGNLYISDIGNNRIRKVNTLGIINAIAGSGIAGFSGDGGNPLSARLNHAQGLYIDGTGTVYIADENNSRIRKVSGSGYGPSFSGGATQTITVCENAAVNAFGALLAARDSDVGQTETLTLATAPAHGTISGLPLSLTSNGGAFTVTGPGYTPAAGYSGTDVFSVRISDGRTSAITTIHVTVSPLPLAGFISAPVFLCVADSVALGASIAGGLWSSTSDFIALTGTGEAYALVPGVDTIFYSVSNSCGTAVATKIITVSPLADAGVIVAASYNICLGDTMVFASASFTTVIDSGGIWSVSNGAAVINPENGTLTGISADTLTVYYTVANSCNISVASQPVEVNAMPAAGMITGLSSLCEGYLVLLSDTAASGAWYSTNANASITDGIVAGLSGGRDTILYAITNACGSDTAYKVITVDATPVSASITGPSAVCVGSSVNLSDTSHDGIWSPSNDHAGVTGSGEVFGLSPGMDTISYIITNSCGSVSSHKVITVKPFSAGVIAGEDSVCTTQTILLADTTSGGSWSSQFPSLASVSAAGIVTGISPGADSIFYSVTNACGTARTGTEITVMPGSFCGLTEVSAIQTAQPAMLQIYPNPNDGVFEIRLVSVEDEAVHVVITNLSSEIIKEFSSRTNSSSALQLYLPSGIYFISATTSDARYIGKMVIR